MPNYKDIACVGISSILLINIIYRYTKLTDIDNVNNGLNYNEDVRSYNQIVLLSTLTMIIITSL